jgi:uncharacterized membrane protein
LYGPVNVAPGALAPRLSFLDLARCLAIVLMVFAHLVDALLLPEQWGSSFGLLYRHARGITAPLFFAVSGWAFAVAVVARFEQHRDAGPLRRARFRRAAVLFLWGSALTLPWWADGFPFAAADDVWIPFRHFGVLHCLAAALVAALGLVRLSRTPTRFALLSAGAAAASVLAAPFVHALLPGLPAYVQGMFDQGSFTGAFPLFPWTAFFFSGAAFGAWARLQRWSTTRIARRAVVLAGLSLAASLAMAGVCYRLIPTERVWTSPGLYLLRQSVAFALLAAMAALAPLVRGRYFALPARHALSFYVGHMVLIWGVPKVLGLHHRIGFTLTFAEVAWMTATMLALLWVAIEGFGRVRRAAAGWLGERATAPEASSSRGSEGTAPEAG